MNQRCFDVGSGGWPHHEAPIRGLVRAHALVRLMHKGMGMTGAFLSVSMADYEHVTISEVKNGDLGTGITVTFKDATCPKHQGQ